MIRCLRRRNESGACGGSQWQLALVAALLWSCSSGQPAGLEPRGDVAAGGTAAQLVLHAADAEVWAWRVRVRGALRGPGRLSACAIVVAGTAFEARVTGSDFSAEVELGEGVNAVQARCDAPHRGELRSERVHYTVRLHDTPRALARARLRDDALVLDAGESTPSPRSQAALSEYAWYAGGPLGAPAHTRLGAGEQLVLSVPAEDGDHTFELRVADARGRSDLARVLVAVRGGRVLEPSAGERPSWLREAIVYGVVPPLFGSPPLRSVTARLGELAQLGVTALWFSPIFESPDDDFGYAVTDYFAVRDDYGSEQDLAQLVERAHAHGLRVLLDTVPNHTSNQHPYFVQAQALARRSHHFDFYDRDAQGRPTHYFDWEHLPNLEYDNAEVERFVTEAGVHWLRDFQVDGYRVDAAWGVARRDPSFFAAWLGELRRVRPDALVVAEASARDPYYVQTGFDAAYDWTDEPGRWAWQDVFARPTGIAQRLHAAIAESAQHTPPERVLRFLNNNDTGKRFITRHGEAMTRVATAALLTLPGVPCLFAFDEVGAEFEPYIAEGPISVPEREALRRFHAQLIGLRRTTPALQGAGFSALHVGTHDEVYAFVRAPDAGAFAGCATNAAMADLAIVALNFSGRAAVVRLRVPAALATGQRELHVRDALTGERLRVPLSAPTPGGAAFELALPPWGVRILQPA